MNKLIIIVFAATLIGCSSATYLSGTSAVSTVTMNTVVNSEIEVDTTKTLTGQSTTTITFGVFKSGDNVFSDAYNKSGVGAKECSAAVYKALNGSGYDVIVNPKYVILQKNSLFTRQTTAKVTGYGGKIKIKL